MGSVSCFNLPKSFVWSNLACVGSSARFTCPVHGGGTGPALYGGYTLGKHLGKALKRKSPLEKALIDYQEEIKTKRGKEHDYHYRQKISYKLVKMKSWKQFFSSIKHEELLKVMSLRKREILKIIGRISRKNFKIRP